MTDRRFSDDDARRILALAAEAEAASTPELPWTLTELQRVAAEAGLSPASVTAAALALERAEAPAREQHYLGLPIAVGRAVPLARQMTDEEWGALVTRLRDTFATQGKLHVSGARREWRVGNLRVIHEPLGDGALLDLHTRKADARALPTLGVAFMVLGTALGVLNLSVGQPRGLAAAGLVAVIGALSTIFGAVRLPAWARLRARQFDALGDFARRLSAPKA